jgi:arginase
MLKKIHFIINTSEIGAGTRGASLGPDAMFTSARNIGSNLFSKYPITRLQDVNHLLDLETEFKYAKRIDGLITIYDRLNENISKSLINGNFPIVLASDHGSAGGTIAGIKTAFPNKKIGVVWIDAHGDLHSPYTTPSGNLHGMPLSTALADDNLQCKSNDVPEKTIHYWEKLKNIGGICPKIEAENLIFVAVRDTEPQEDALIERRSIKNHTVQDVISKGENVIAKEILTQLSDCDYIYISFDVDAMDPNETSHGTGTPVDNGLTPIQAENIIKLLIESKKIICLEIVEVNPCLDEKMNKMADTAFLILEKLVVKIDD